MKILVTGAGRGGTNLVTELMRNSNVVNFTSEIEDRKLFSYGVLIPNYGTKLATENSGFTLEGIQLLLKNNPDLYVIFSLRHPIDNCLSKILRGQPKSMGGDSRVEQKAPDATLKGSVGAIKHMYKIYSFIKENYPKQLITIKMEDLITESDKIIKYLTNEFNIENSDKMYDFHKTNRNGFQKKRYGDKLHNHVNLYHDLNNNFDGFFKNKSDLVNELKEELKEEIVNLDYSL
jgi:hypothetical protein